jgi:hypothetical protein
LRSLDIPALLKSWQKHYKHVYLTLNVVEPNPQMPSPVLLQMLGCYDPDRHPQ